MTAGAETIVATSEAALLTERVRRTVGMIQRRQQVFQKYAEDISGKTGLGAIAALAYVNRVIERREPVSPALLSHSHWSRDYLFIGHVAVCVPCHFLPALGFAVSA